MSGRAPRPDAEGIDAALRSRGFSEPARKELVEIVCAVARLRDLLGAAPLGSPQASARLAAFLDAKEIVEGVLVDSRGEALLLGCSNVVDELVAVGLPIAAAQELVALLLRTAHLRRALRNRG